MRIKYRTGRNVTDMNDDYQSFLESINSIFLKAMVTKDYKLALQAKALEAKCRGYLNRTLKNQVKFDTSIEGLKELLDSLNKELKDQEFKNNNLE